MKRYRVVLSKSAEKELHRLPVGLIPVMVTLIQSLETNPRPAGCKKLKGYKDLWRIRQGDYRIIYSIQDKIVQVEVLAIGNRRDIYK
jgi:mRNA interferase RelE/StbE